MCPFKKRNCVSVLRSMYFHTLHHYYGLIGLLAVHPVVLVVLALVTTVPCFPETARPPRYAADTLTSRPALQRRWCPIESGIAIQPILVATIMRVSPTTLSGLTTLDCFRLFRFRALSLSFLRLTLYLTIQCPRTRYWPLCSKSYQVRSCT